MLEYPCRRHLFFRFLLIILPESSLRGPIKYFLSYSGDDFRPARGLRDRPGIGMYSTPW